MSVQGGRECSLQDTSANVCILPGHVWCCSLFWAQKQAEWRG